MFCGTHIPRAILHEGLIILICKMTVKIMLSKIPAASPPWASELTNISSNLTDWGRVTHICVSKLTIIGSDNGLLPGQCQAIIWTYAEILLIWPSGTQFSEIFIKIHTFSFKKMPLKRLPGKWRPCCLGLNVLFRIRWAWSLSTGFPWWVNSLGM